MNAVSMLRWLVLCSQGKNTSCFHSSSSAAMSLAPDHIEMDLYGSRQKDYNKFPSLAMASLSKKKKKKKQGN